MVTCPPLHNHSETHIPRHICHFQSSCTWYLCFFRSFGINCSTLPPEVLAESLAVELAPFGVRVLNVAPGAFRTEGIYSNGFYDQNKLASYDDIRNAAAKRFASIPGTEKGDPTKAMEILVDVVRGEGVAKDKPWPEMLVLGEDAELDIREKCERTLRTLDEWKAVSANLNLEDE